VLGGFVVLLAVVVEKIGLLNFVVLICVGCGLVLALMLCCVVVEKRKETREGGECGLSIPKSSSYSLSLQRLTVRLERGAADGSFVMENFLPQGSR